MGEKRRGAEEMERNALLTLAINKLAHDWSHLNWEFRDFSLDGKPDKMSQWQGDPNEDIMIVVFKGNHIVFRLLRMIVRFIGFLSITLYEPLLDSFDVIINLQCEKSHLLLVPLSPRRMLSQFLCPHP